jgi:hypothetical protein
MRSVKKAVKRFEGSLPKNRIQEFDDYGTWKSEDKK